MFSTLRKKKALVTLAGTCQRGKEEGSLVPVHVYQADRCKQGQVTQVYRSVASLAGVVLTLSSRQRGKSPQAWWLETLFQKGPCNKM